MGWGNVSIFPLLIVQSGQPNTGFFVYSVPPPLGSGNPPVLSIVAPGVTSDPFGNPVNAVLNIGNFSAAHSGFDQNGIEYLSDATGVVRIVADPARGMFFYTGAAALGNPPQLALALSGVTLDTFGNAVTSSKILMQANVITESGGIFRTAATAPLIQLDGPHNAYLQYDASAFLAATIAPVLTSDGLGNTVQAGFTAYSASLFAQLQSATLSFGGTGITAAALLGSSGSAGLVLSTGRTAALTVEAVMNLISVAAGAVPTVQVTAGALELSESAVPAADGGVHAGPLLFGTAGGHLQVVADSLNGDGQTYGTERAIQRTTATQQFTLASAVAITGLSRPLGVGSYHVRLKVFWVPSGVVGSTHTHNFAFSGTATGNVNGQCWQAQAAFTVQQTSLNAGAGNNLTAGLLSPTHVAFAGWTELEADITVTVAGTLTHTITLTTAGDDITTSAGTFWKIEPL